MRTILFVKKYLLLLPLILVVFVGSLVYTSTSGNKINNSKDLNADTVLELPKNGISPTLKLCIKDSDQRRCFTNYFNYAIGKYNSKDLANQLYYYRTAVPTATQYCHDQALAIGIQAWGEYKDLDKVLEFGTPVCASGFLHGVQEAVGLDLAIPTETLVSLVSKVCSEITNDDFKDSNYRVCYHGIGHAVAKRTSNDIEKGMEICATLDATKPKTNPFDASYTKRELCSEGLSMRFFESIVLDVTKDATLPKKGVLTINENPYQICDKQKDLSLRYGCFEYGTRAFTHTDLDYNRTAMLCNLYKKIDQVPCYFGISREVAYTAETDTFTNVTEICSQANDPDASYICGMNAIMNRITIDNNITAPLEICGRLPKNAVNKRICTYVKDHLVITSSENERNINK
jgi:hypothetical protein